MTSIDGAIERNWAGNVVFSPAHAHGPRSIDELQQIVSTAANQGRRVHAVGSAHSFSTVADTDGDLVSMRALDRVIAIDRDAMTVTLEAGIRYGELGGALHVEGLALHNLPSLPHITVAGAIATGTHGSGVVNPNLAAAVSAIEMIDASGALIRLSRVDDPEVFPGSVVALGALGVVTSVTLAVEPTFDVAQVLYLDLPIDVGIEHLDAIMASAYSVSMFTDWRGDVFGQVWCKRRLGDGGYDTSEQFVGRRADRPLHIIQGLSPDACTEQLGVPGPWHERLPHFRIAFSPSVGDELQSEYFVAVVDGPAALSAVRDVAPRLASVLVVSEVRNVAADDLWLSPAYLRKSLALHFTWVPDQPAVMALLPVLEAALAPFGARPHWGKLTAMEPATVRARVPRLGDFFELVDALDPSGVFSNGYIDRLRS
jgi:xylitol oxidase